MASWGAEEGRRRSSGDLVRGSVFQNGSGQILQSPDEPHNDAMYERILVHVARHILSLYYIAEELGWHKLRLTAT